MTRFFPLALSFALGTIAVAQADESDLPQVPTVSEADNQQGLFPQETIAALADSLRDRDRRPRADRTAARRQRLGPRCRRLGDSRNRNQRPNCYRLAGRFAA